MKLRIKGNSIRLRLTQSEVAQFASTGSISEQTQFANGALVYNLVKVEVNELSATLEGTSITVQVPVAIAENWTATEEVGFQNNYRVNENTNMSLLVEKDFVCLDNTFEDQSDNYPNPNAVC